MPQLQPVTALADVAGFRTAAVHCGLKNDRPDLALIVSDLPTTCAAVFTQNTFAAAPVHVSRQHVADGDIRAIVINAGIANACTGRQGLRDALTMARETAEAVAIKPEQVIVSSTGRIGPMLPMEKIVPGIHDAAGRLGDGDVSTAILTTDSGPKTASATFTADKEYTLAGIAKGAGMIHPDMATMLAVITTDAAVEKTALRDALRAATNVSFNQISVDGDGSTNDMATVMANGAAGGVELKPGVDGWDAFVSALTTITQDLARQIAADGEGASRLMEVHVKGAADDIAARKAARAVAASNLVKTALNGGDPNWGRILSSAGSTYLSVEPDMVRLTLGSKLGQVTVIEDGAPTGADASRVVATSEVVFELIVGDGPGNGTAWGCDLSPEYVDFNATGST